MRGCSSFFSIFVLPAETKLDLARLLLINRGIGAEINSGIDMQNSPIYI